MRKKISISEIILIALAKAIDGYIRIDDFINNPGYYAYHGGWDYPLKKSSLAQALRRLRIDGYLDLDQYNNKLVLKLTESGKKEAVLTKALRDNNWDGKWRILVFDIPEKHRKVRNILRSRLKTWGFELYQKSVWVSKKNITQPLRQFIKEIGVEKWVKLFESNDLVS